MFRWVCLGIGVVFLAVMTWMVNDVRLHVRQSGETVQTTGETINKRLPEIVGHCAPPVPLFAVAAALALVAFTALSV